MKQQVANTIEELLSINEEYLKIVNEIKESNLSEKAKNTSISLFEIQIKANNETSKSLLESLKQD